MKSALLLIGLLVSSWALAESIHSITLKHRLASELLPEIEAFVPETATIRAYNDTLILKSDRATLANVQQLVDKLDKPQQGLMVSVLRSSHELQQKRGAGNRVEIGVDDGLDGSVSINRWSTRDHNDLNQQYQARTVAGYPVSISLGESQPEQQQLVFVGPRGVAVAEETRYISTANGFQALPQLLPDGRVRVEIHPFFSKLSRVDGGVDSSDLITTVSGHLDEWLEIGRINDSSATQQEGVTSYRSHRGQSQILYLKVELSN
jgi:hypothetical protein